MGMGNLDWNQIWKDQVRENRSVPGFKSGTDLWKKKKVAEEYRAPAERVKTTLALLPLGPTLSVLDIGAGPGTLAIPLAGQVRSITAVEPAAGMASVIREKTDVGACRNLRVVQERWEDVVPACDLDGPYDLVLASFSLGMEDLAGALEKMDAVSSGSVHLFWFADVPGWERHYLEIWPSLHAAQYRPVPKADVVFNLLWQRGKHPDLVQMPLVQEEWFRDLDEAFFHYAPKFGVADVRQEGVLRTALERWLVREGEMLVMRERSHAAHIWWEKEEDAVPWCEG
ncbi:SAM-dependent methyltransferase [Methanofollis sp. W23]|uniref:class I SAM-dependent DNA methyltransferase n=1 Tax=Methanofollis sp. W23 TaxID=2817849 RepID=UPI001AE8C0BB|nr:class I SAM-dependent methyltransferase [Methanofollis sp. W23]MBP2146831.1 SAM-dependent methyltransferase [Methanofollis sp. W23]